MKGQAQSISPFDSDPNKRYSLEEYFDFELKAEHRHEYWNGSIRAMSYTSPEHGEIQTNLSDTLAACLNAKGCKRYSADRMVYVPSCNKVFYPDLVIVCGEQEFFQYKKKMKATINPTAIIEILSNSTEQQDRIDKWMCYRSIPSLQQYVMVQQDVQSIHSYRRKSEREWEYAYADKAEDAVEILECVVRLEAVYAGVNLP